MFHKMSLRTHPNYLYQNHCVYEFHLTEPRNEEIAVGRILAVTIKTQRQALKMKRGRGNEGRQRANFPLTGLLITD